MSYQLLKMLHIFGAIIFVGNIIVTGLWKAMADRTKEPDVVAFGQRLVTITDIVFTALGAGLVLISGLLMATTFADKFWTIPWLAWGLGLFAASAVLWIAVLIPIQVRQARLARTFETGQQIPEEYWSLGRRWMWVGIIATVLPLTNVYFMVFKPT